MSTVPERTWQASGLPPYGYLPTLAVPSNAAPDDWINEPTYLPWRDSMLQLFTDLLWPECDPAAKSWRGNAVTTMEALTIADLQILQQIRPARGRLIDTLPVSPLRHLACPPHRIFFEGEDVGPPKTVEWLRFYDRDASKDLILDAIPVLMSRAMSRKAPVGLIYWFKEKLQRFRPYQAGLLLGLEITHIGATTALHPAMISGHSFQGICALIGVMERFELDRVALSASLAQYLLDFGDRRVMAGVHFPSDNLASWILALEICDYAVAPAVSQQVKQQVWHAIRDQSVIYRLIADHVKEHSDSPFAAALKELQLRGEPA
jgi:PAP2 superfamily